MEEYAENELQRSIATIVLKTGFTSMSASALATLTEITQNNLMKLATKTARLSHLCGLPDSANHEPNVSDLNFTLNHFNVSTTELVEYRMFLQKCR